VRPDFIEGLYGADGRIRESRMPLDWNPGGGGGGSGGDGYEWVYVPLTFAGREVPLRTVIPIGYDQARIAYLVSPQANFRRIQFRRYWDEHVQALVHIVRNQTCDISDVSGQTVIVTAETEDGKPFLGDVLLKLTATHPQGDKIYYPVCLTADSFNTSRTGIPAGYTLVKIDFMASDGGVPILELDREYGTSVPLTLTSEARDATPYAGAPVKITPYLNGEFSRADFLVTFIKEPE
jgi:hypothetical protein